MDVALIPRRTALRKASAQCLAERRVDEDLASTIIKQIFDLEAQGVLLPDGWRDRRPMTLRYLTTILKLGITLMEARG